MIQKLNSYDDSLLCSLVHKFGRRGGEATEFDYDKYIDELKKALPADFKAKGKIFVFVDECHRTQSGKLHAAMQAIMPEAIFIGFTGTPLLKKDKKTSIEVFGTYIHSYKYNEAVRDGVVLDLRYEYRDIPQNITAHDRIDQWFDVKTRTLSSRAKAKLKEKWASMQKIYSSRSRLERVAWDIIQDFDLKPRLMDGNGNAILVADSIYTACKYYEIFQQRGFKKCAIISSYTPQAGDLRTDTVSADDETETFEKYEIYLRMLGFDPDNLPEKVSIQKKVEAFEKEVKEKFVNEPANMKLLIVVDKLLTGFDAPPCTYLYIDKSMQDHGLFQAICRVNRLDGDTKEFGYIVDYKQLFGDLKNAMDKYTSGAFENYDPEDVDGLIKDRAGEAIKHFREIYEELEELCEGVEAPKEDLQYLHYFCGVSGMSEESLLSSELDVFGLVVFEDGNIKDKNKNIVIRNAKRGTVLIDPRVYYERTLGTVNFTIAHECFHWHRHQPYHALMKMLGANDELGKIIQCSIGSNSKDSEKWKAIDWMEWQANGVAPHILMPTSTAKIKVTELIEKYQIHFDGMDGYRIEDMILELADFYGLSKLAVKMRIREMGYAKIDGVFTYVNGQ